MSKTRQKADDWFKKLDRWRDEALALRELLLASELSEDFKWGNPCYTLDGGNVVTIWNLKNCLALAFFKGALMKDSAVVLVAPGENSQTIRKIEFQALAEIAEQKALLTDYINQAVQIEKAGLKIDRSARPELEYPDELVAKLDGDTAFREAFEALTPGRQRGYVLHFMQAKQSATRTARIEKFAPTILAGKGMHDR